MPILIPRDVSLVRITTERSWEVAGLTNLRNDGTASVVLNSKVHKPNAFAANALSGQFFGSESNRIEFPDDSREDCLPFATNSCVAVSGYSSPPALDSHNDVNVETVRQSARPRTVAAAAISDPANVSTPNRTFTAAISPR
jgi:hypothetical protein